MIRNGILFPDGESLRRLDSGPRQGATSEYPALANSIGHGLQSGDDGRDLKRPNYGLEDAHKQRITQYNTIAYPPDQDLEPSAAAAAHPLAAAALHHSSSASTIPLKTASADEILNYSAQVLSRFNKANKQADDDGAYEDDD